VATVLGRVAVAGVHASPGGIRQVIGVDVLAHRWILPGGSEKGPSELEVFAALPGPAAFQARAEGEGGEAPAIDEEQIPGRSARTFDIEVPGATVVVESEGGQPFAAGRRLAAEAADPAETPAREETGGPGQGSGGGGGGKGTPGSSRGTGRQGGGREQKEETEASDLAVTSGVAEPAPAWVVLPAAAEGPGVLVVDNPTSVPATVDISLLAQEGPVGPAGASPLEVPPATSVVVDLSENGNLPVAVVVRCTSGTVAAAQAASGPDGFAVTVGIPVDPSLSF
jgi:hypothetical protein